MKLESTFSPGDSAWIVRQGYEPEMVTIGLVRIEIIDTPGIDQSDSDVQFDNYKAKKSRKEQYMCIETGIESGTVYILDEHIFTNEQDALKVANKQKEEVEKRNLEYELSNIKKKRKLVKELKASFEYHENELKYLEEQKKQND